jgi:predicted transposase/invertase (TIGR01784 family)
MDNLRYQRSVIQTGLIEGHEIGKQEGLIEGIEKGIEQIVLTGNRNGFTVEQIMAFSGLSREKILEIIKTDEKKS